MATQYCGINGQVGGLNGLWYNNFNYGYKPKSIMIPSAFDMPEFAPTVSLPDYTLFGGFSTTVLRKLQRQVNKILRNRAKERAIECSKLEDGWQAFANFMAGVAWAMACRQVLRWSKGHKPEGGHKAADGSPWFPVEICEASMMYDKAAYKKEMNFYTNPFRRWHYLDINYMQDMQTVIGLLDSTSTETVREIPF